MNKLFSKKVITKYNKIKKFICLECKCKNGINKIDATNKAVKNHPGANVES